MQSRPATGFSAHIDHVEVRDRPVNEGTLLDKGMSFLASRISLMGEGQHAVFHIKVQKGDESYSIVRRFSEFSNMHDQLKATFGPSLPAHMPSKTVIRSFDPGQLDDRKNALNAYLKEMCTRRDVVESGAWLRFFDPNASPAPISTGAAMQFRQQAEGGAPIPGIGGSGAIAGGGGQAALPGASLGGAPAQHQPPRTVGDRHDDEDDLVGWDR